jgi:hypothetical protein
VCCSNFSTPVAEKLLNVEILPPVGIVSVEVADVCFRAEFVRIGLYPAAE